MLRGENAKTANASTTPTAQNASNTRESCSRGATLPPTTPHMDLQGHFTQDAANAGTEVAPTLWFRGGHYHKSPNDATLQLCTPKREPEQVFHLPLLAANYINANAIVTLVCSNASISCHCLSSAMKTAL